MTSHPLSRVSAILPCLLVAALAALAPACASSSSSSLDGATPYEPPEPPEELPIGFYMSRLDGAIRGWSNLKLDSRNDPDHVKLRGIERDLRYNVRRRQEEILEQLDVGPPKNRSVAAVALGFSGDPGVLSPLLAAIDDPDSEIANNALLGIGILALPETPLTQIAWTLDNHVDGWVRVNAAFAIQRVVSAGGNSDVVPRVCRDALVDTEPGVRAQAAAILGLIGDDESLTSLGDLLYDSENLVAAAAATSLGRIGRIEPEAKGRVARLLVGAYENCKGSTRSHMRLELTRLNEGDLGADLGPWREWAYKLP